MCIVWAKPVADATLRPRTSVAMRTVECVMLISSLLERELRKASVREAFAKAFRGNHDRQPGFCGPQLLPERGRDRGRKNPLFERAALLCPRQRQRPQKGGLPLRRALELTSLKVERRQPPHITAIDCHLNRTIENDFGLRALVETAVCFGEQRQVVGPACLRTTCIEPRERGFDDPDALARVVLSACPSDQHARPIAVVREPITLAQPGGRFRTLQRPLGVEPHPG